MELRRVVVTGLGLVTPLGCGVEATWANILAGKSGAKRIEDFQVDDIASSAAFTEASPAVIEDDKGLPMSFLVKWAFASPILAGSVQNNAALLTVLCQRKPGADCVEIDWHGVSMRYEPPPFVGIRP